MTDSWGWEAPLLDSKIGCAQPTASSHGLSYTTGPLRIFTKTQRIFSLKTLCSEWTSLPQKSYDFWLACFINHTFSSLLGLQPISNITFELEQARTGYKYPAFLTGFSQSKSARICISNHCLLLWQHPPGCAVSSTMQSWNELKAFLLHTLCIQEMGLLAYAALPHHHHTKTKCFLAALMQCKKHKECIYMHNSPRNSRSRETTHLFFLPYSISIIMWQNDRFKEHRQPWIP